MEKPITQIKGNDYSLLEKQKQALDDSIMYASYIQSAMLPSQNKFDRIFPQNFILNLPRDVVSGDFYWIHKNLNKVVFCAADCTGHGVPGAFMSMLGISTLNQIVLSHKNISAGNILDILREYIMKSLQQTGRFGELQDGMDIALGILDFDSNEFQFSGAYNPLYLIRNGVFFEYEGNRMPVGIALDEERPFKTHKIHLHEGDMLYLFSDGFADQFGGEKGKKYKYKSFQQFLTKISKFDTTTQKKLLLKEFYEWKGEQNQLDDVLVMGIRHSIPE